MTIFKSALLAVVTSSSIAFYSWLLAAPTLSHSAPGLASQENLRCQPTGMGLRFKLVEDFSVGGDREPLSRVTGMFVGPNGNLFVLQPDDHRIVQLDSKGRVVASRGRDGGGPGEFIHLTGAGFIGDTLWASDIARRTITRYPPKGDVIAEVWKDSTGAPHAAPLALIGDGNVIVQAFISRVRPDESYDEYEYFFLVNRNGGVMDTILRRDFPKVYLLRPPEAGGFVVQKYLQPLSNEPLLAVASSGKGWIVVERPMPRKDTSSTFQVYGTGPTLKMRFSFASSYRPCPVNRRVRDSLEKRYALPGKRESEKFLPALSMPPYLPSVSDALIAEDGAIWIRREGLEHDAAVWQRFDRKGKGQGWFVSPTRARLFAARGDTIWGARADGDSVLTIHRWHLTP